ncbi:hypothetical protein CBS101457_006448 [Exobasidium rhododendri]|nr:hypothetical protein CBS101457_006448 [Exobasidium rhododendri]
MAVEEAVASPSMPGKPAMPQSTSFSAEDFFATQQAPSNLSSHGDLARKFVERHHREGRKVVLVTSGGTTVPLERNVVRFLDNFSAGTRGATSAEYFLAAGYAVIFMHRQHSLSPYTRHYSHTTNPFLDLLFDPSKPGKDGKIHDQKEIIVSTKYSEALRPILRDYDRARKAGTLLRLTFVTVNDYLFLLREMSRIMQPLGRSGMYYLAAAVSDFYVPSQKTPEHKIQSGKGSLVIEMDQVPKVLKPMVQQWAPEGFIVSFKLETDGELLIPKARAALERYGHQVVVGNDLNRRKFEVVFVERKEGIDETGPSFQEKWLRLEEGGGVGVGSGSSHEHKREEKEIEEDIVRELQARHERWISLES